MNQTNPVIFYVGDDLLNDNQYPNSEYINTHLKYNITNDYYNITTLPYTKPVSTNYFSYIVDYIMNFLNKTF
jgi:hypothetical protein